MYLTINTLNCTTAHIFNAFETIQHEMVHADIKRRLVQDYGLTNTTQLSVDQAFHQLVLQEYGGNAGTTEHELMLEYYLDDMAQSILDANDGIGTLQQFRDLVLYGLGAATLSYCSYDFNTVVNNYNSFMSWATIPGNISQDLAGCP